MGFLKYSISFTRAREARMNLEELALKDKRDTTTLQIPANIQMKKKQIVINLFRAADLVAHDGSGKADPYVKFFLGGISIQSKIKE